MNRIFVQKLITSILAFFVFIPMSTCTREESIPFHEKLFDARESFQNVYYELVKKGYFDTLYNNNLIFSTDFDSAFPRNGATLLALTEWLEKNQDSESQFLLKKMNKFFGLQFHRFICKIDVPKSELGVVSNSFHTLYGHKISTIDPSFETHPFRSTLSKAMIFLLMMEFGDKNYQQKKENIVYFMEGVRNKLIKINRSLSNEMQVSQDHFDIVINHIESYALREPLIKPVNIKLIIFFVTLGIAVTTLVVWVVFYKIPKDVKLWDGFKQLLSSFAEAIGQSVTKGAITEISSPDRQVVANIQREATGLINVAVSAGSEAIRPHLGQVLEQIGQLRQELNQNMTNLVNQVDDRVNQIPLNLINPVPNQQVQNGNQNNGQSPVNILAQQLGSGAIQGIRHELYNSLPRFVTGPYNYLFGNRNQQPQNQNQQPNQEQQQDLVQQVNVNNVINDVPHDNQPVDNGENHN